MIVIYMKKTGLKSYIKNLYQAKLVVIWRMMQGGAG